MTNQEFIDAIKSLTVLELNDLVKACEEEFGVSAAAAANFSSNQATLSSEKCSPLLRFGETLINQ